MTLPTNYLDTVAAARDPLSGPLVVPWPMPGNASNLSSFATLAEWRELVLRFSVHPAIPLIVTAKFERAQKLYVLSRLDLDLIKAGELVALTALELALTDRYAGAERQRRRKLVAAKLEKEKRKISKGERWWVENISFADLLKYMVERDGLTEDQVPMYQRCGPTTKVIGPLTGETRPSLTDIRNDLAHGAPFGGFPWAGLLELVRDLIDYAYRDWNLA
ncbi:hypothetical protein SAMN05519103_08511 [Rhizobiales bacterium GAS113]|nr:hypothetical protein SAMN05519103_08511 [Rhizobiales bacterium GAS113]